MKYSLLLILITSTVIFSCNKDDQQKPFNGKIDEKTSEIVAADNDFGLELFKQAVQNDDQAQNIFLSPVSVQMALAMVYNGSNGETRTAMENTLKKNGFSTEEINKGYQSLINVLINADPKVKVELANSIWYRQGFDVLPGFIDTNLVYYDAATTPLDFTDPSAVDVINNWVSDKTHEKIKTIINQIQDGDMMFLINAIYFKGIWRSEFDKSKTTEQPFTLPDNSEVQVEMMQQQDTIKYTANSLFESIELPYGDEDYNMIIILPAPDKTINEVTGSLNAQAWNDLLNSFSPRDVIVHMPKLKFEYNTDLKNTLSDMGMEIAFTDNADFTGINPNGGLMISSVKHKTFVEVNEEGTEAAAVTSIGVVGTSYPPEESGPVYFTVDRPFVLAIREKISGSIVFIGQVTNPLSTSNE